MSSAEWACRANGGKAGATAKGISPQQTAGLGLGTQTTERYTRSLCKWTLGVDLLLTRGHILTQKLRATSDPVQRPRHHQSGTPAPYSPEADLEGHVILISA